MPFFTAMLVISFGPKAFHYMGESGIPTRPCFFRKKFSAASFTLTSCSLVIFFFIPLTCDISAWPDLLPYPALMMFTTWYGECILLPPGGDGRDIPSSSLLATFPLLSDGSTSGCFGIRLAWVGRQRKAREHLLCIVESYRKYFVCTFLLDSIFQ